MRILLADDAALLREGLAGLLTTAGHEVVAQVADADALRTEVSRLAAAGELPDVVVTDVRMPPTGTDDGLRAAIDLRRTYPGLPVVVLSAYVAGPYVQDLLEETESPTSPTELGAPSASSGGAVGYLLKERVGRVADFLHSLDIVVGGGVVIDPEVVSHLIKAARAAGNSNAGDASSPSERRDPTVGAHEARTRCDGANPAAALGCPHAPPRCRPPPHRPQALRPA